MERVLIVSSDGHAGVPFARYRDYLDPAYYDDFDQYDRSQVALTDAQVFAPEAAADREEIAAGVDFTDPHGRIRDHERMGVVAEVLYPGASPDTSAPWSDFLSLTAFRIRTPRGRELQAAGEKAYNRWLADFCSVAPDRLLGLAHVPLHDPQLAVSEIEWAAEHGFVGILLPFFNYDVPEYAHLWYWEPIWRACVETGLTINFHGGYGYSDLGNHPALMGFDTLHFSTRPVAHLVFSGAFDLLPELRMSITEFGASWVPGLLQRLDGLYVGAQAQAALRPVLTRDDNLPQLTPSEYWGRNVYVGTSLLSLPELQQRDEIGVESMMYGLDYPHTEGSWGDTITFLRSSFGKADMTEEEARAVLGGNAVRMYDLDLDALLPVVERVGPELADVLTSATDSETQALIDDVTGNKRSLAAGHLQGAMSRVGRD